MQNFYSTFLNRWESVQKKLPYMKPQGVGDMTLRINADEEKTGT